jgi:hypothetical protein
MNKKLTEALDGVFDLTSDLNPLRNLDPKEIRLIREAVEKAVFPLVKKDITETEIRQILFDSVDYNTFCAICDESNFIGDLLKFLNL